MTTKTHAGPVRGRDGYSFTWCGRPVRKTTKVGGIVTCKECIAAYRRDSNIAKHAR